MAVVPRMTDWFLIPYPLLFAVFEGEWSSLRNQSSFREIGMGDLNGLLVDGALNS